MRLIDADALCTYANNNKEKTIDANDIMRFPIVDAVPVIRCKDCKHCDEGECWKYLGIYDVVSDMDYCSRGERKEETECD